MFSTDKFLGAYRRIVQEVCGDGWNRADIDWHYQELQARLKSELVDTRKMGEVEFGQYFPIATKCLLFDVPWSVASAHSLSDLTAMTAAGQAKPVAGARKSRKMLDKPISNQDTGNKEKGAMPRGRPRKQSDTAQPAPTALPDSQGITKMEGVRRALAKLGKGAKPLEIKDYLKTTFNIEMDTSVISAYKTTLSKKAAGKSGVIRQKAPEPKAVAPKAVAGGISLEDILAVKELADRLGADKLRQLAEVLVN